eukprot:CAMPEP_0174383570 /NCGR_PEP_ID=MMETSP0811_2-20130205/125328_1 /TAXON_ID=73025 ORGANISM="Eutreptiella gymnastica-like, Strain CCMP1594" /NCGR_SAMPLE_ID=MMETSP0811_2 /ASSEMBLY_ACC=CAM_ASM_000667 /LENGTH=269 /DNA_ID=CAMNT_0015537213 /DNA_START=417 /DNA_END=1228 /DNA_ORIENTATION=-
MPLPVRHKSMRPQINAATRFTPTNSLPQTTNGRDRAFNEGSALSAQRNVVFVGWLIEVFGGGKCRGRWGMQGPLVVEREYNVAAEWSAKVKGVRSNGTRDLTRHTDIDKSTDVFFCFALGTGHQITEWYCIACQPPSVLPQLRVVTRPPPLVIAQQPLLTLQPPSNGRQDLGDDCPCEPAGLRYTKQQGLAGAGPTVAVGVRTAASPSVPRSGCTSDLKRSASHFDHGSHVVDWGPSRQRPAGCLLHSAAQPRHTGQPRTSHLHFCPQL